MNWMAWIDIPSKKSVKRTGGFARTLKGHLFTRRIPVTNRRNCAVAIQVEDRNQIVLLREVIEQALRIGQHDAVWVFAHLGHREKTPYGGHAVNIGDKDSIGLGKVLGAFFRKSLVRAFAYAHREGHRDMRHIIRHRIGQLMLILHVHERGEAVPGSKRRGCGEPGATKQANESDEKFREAVDCWIVFHRRYTTRER